MTDSSGERQPTRRQFLKAAGAVALLSGCGGGAGRAQSSERFERMIVLGVDGMDPKLVEQFVSEGRMPNCARLIKEGSFHRLRTSNPPQSAVAWSNFISGTNPGGHGIFDFIARDPETMLPYHSISLATPASGLVKFGRWQLPLSPGEIVNRRRGETFWTHLEDNNVPCTIFRVPVNFPPTESEATALSGMGTPDLLGGYGEFTYFTNDPKQRTRNVSGGRIERVKVEDHVIETSLRGPTNAFLSEESSSEVPLQIYLDPERPLAKMVIGDQEVLLQEGEWSDWVIVRFPMLPHVVEVSGICRLLLKRAYKGFGFDMYVSPINIDPAEPSLPIASPPDYSQRLVNELGYFYTQGMIEDTSALNAGVLTNEEYRQQSTYVIDERMRFFKHELGRFKDGFLFYYFSSLDLNSHVFWRTRDELHPAYSPDLAAAHGDFIDDLYAMLDNAIGQALERVDDKTLLMVMSDHGFTSFRRQFNLNSWLMDNGYVLAKDASKRGTMDYLQNVDWSGTRAYGLGINGLYLNLKGRESQGTVASGREADALMDELIDKLTQVRDPDNGAQVIANVYRATEIYDGPHMEDAPDLIVAYADYYRASWDTVLGSFPKQHILDNTDAWSGDHCVDPSIVPGVLLSNRPIQLDDPELADLAPTILSGFGVHVPSAMTGRNLL
ncbi:MAG: alkaline phosphatase family protein [Planctomycetaceae bacterium]|nr:alkaline phosphatase family protein [Planctomycetaceae bacterium]